MYQYYIFSFSLGSFSTRYNDDDDDDDDGNKNGAQSKKQPKAQAKVPATKAVCKKGEQKASEKKVGLSRGSLM